MSQVIEHLACPEEILAVIHRWIGLQGVFVISTVNVVHAFSSHKKLESIFGSQLHVQLTDGINKMAEWAKSVSIRQSKIFSAIEVDKNLPPSWREITD